MFEQSSYIYNALVDFDSVIIRRSNSTLTLFLRIRPQACAREPPPAVIYALLTAYPDAVSSYHPLSTNGDQSVTAGALPLHYAAQWGASGRLIHYLVQKVSSAACTKDNLGKTPLHLLCENFNANNDPNQSLGLSCDEGMLWIVKLLLDISPDSINVSTAV